MVLFTWKKGGKWILAKQIAVSLDSCNNVVWIKCVNTCNEQRTTEEYREYPVCLSQTQNGATYGCFGKGEE